MRKSAIADFFDVRPVLKTRNLAVMGLLVAVSGALSLFTPWVTPTFKLITLTYIPAVLCSALYGPVAGLLFGFAADFVGYIIKPMGVYFPGFALSAMCANLLYALLLYRQAWSIWRIALARLLVVVLISLGMNAIWFNMLMGMQAGEFYAFTRVIKNFIQYPFDVAILVLLLKAKPVKKLL